MADIWQQFHSLPKSIRDGVATPAAITVIEALEVQYPGADLANIVMRAVIHEFPITDLAKVVATECQLEETAAKSIAERLINDVFVGDIAEYLGVTKTRFTPAPVPIVKNLPAITPPAAPVSRDQPKSPIAPPVNLPVVSLSAPVPPMPKVPPPITHSTATQPKNTAELERLEHPDRAQPAVSLAPTTPIGPVSPTTQYSDEDAKEIESQVARLKQLSTINPNQDFDTIARRVLTEQNVAYSDELLDRRAVAIVKARLKGVRTKDETQDVLVRDAKIGGLGLDLDIAKNVATAADGYAVELKEKGMVREPDVTPPVPPVPLPKVAQEKPEPKPPFRRDGSAPTPIIPINIVDAPRPSRPIVRPIDIPAPKALPPKSPTPVVVPASTTPSMTMPTVAPVMRGADRPTTTDVIRPITRALGPAEEMRSMSLIEFRRLGQGAGESAQRLLEKFKHLQKESFTVWAQAVSGWRQSDVYQLYLTMGRESMDKGVPMAQIIADRGRQGQPYLSEHEFNILADLNRHLQN